MTSTWDTMTVNASRSDTAGPRQAFHRYRELRPACDCPVCSIGRALEDMDAAIDSMVESSHDTEMCLSFLLDEVAKVARSPLGWLVRRRLLQAVRLARPDGWTERGRGDE